MEQVEVVVVMVEQTMMQVVELLVAELVGLKLLSVAVTHIVCTCRTERGRGRVIDTCVCAHGRRHDVWVEKGRWGGERAEQLQSWQADPT